MQISHPGQAYSGWKFLSGVSSVYAQSILNIDCAKQSRKIISLKRYFYFKLYILDLY